MYHGIFVFAAVAIQDHSRDFLLACPIVGVLRVNILKALSIPRITTKLLQLHTQGKVIPSKENFFCPLCQAIITTQQPQLLSPPYTSIVKIISVPIFKFPRINVIFDPVSKSL